MLHSLAACLTQDQTLGVYSTYLKYTKMLKSNFELQVEPLKSGTDIRDPIHYWILKMDPTHH